jgi:hypothetical protein
MSHSSSEEVQLSLLGLLLVTEAERVVFIHAVLGTHLTHIALESTLSKITITGFLIVGMTSAIRSA